MSSLRRSSLLLSRAALPALRPSVQHYALPAGRTLLIVDRAHDFSVSVVGRPSERPSLATSSLGASRVFSSNNMAPTTSSSEKHQIREGECLPLDDITFSTRGDDNKPKPINAKEIFGNKKVAVICIPGAFTPVCSSRHVPGYVEKQDELLSKGVDSIVCIATNDCFVMDAWRKTFASDAKVMFVADQELSFAKATGLDTNLFGSTRLRRFSMLVDNGLVKRVNVESENNNLGVSSADNMLKQLSEDQ